MWCEGGAWDAVAHEDGFDVEALRGEVDGVGRAHDQAVVGRFGEGVELGFLECEGVVDDVLDDGEACGGCEEGADHGGVADEVEEEHESGRLGLIFGWVDGAVVFLEGVGELGGH